MFIKRKHKELIKYEYGVDLYRLYPWANVANPSWGSAIATIRPGESTTPHEHDEFETFIIINGSGDMIIENDVQAVYSGDVIFIPKNMNHQLINHSKEIELVFVTIFWDSPESREKLKSILEKNQDDI